MYTCPLRGREPGFWTVGQLQDDWVIHTKLVVQYIKVLLGLIILRESHVLPN